jgi:GT2 family glycosyltransferase
LISNPTFSIIIPTYHRNDLLAVCLDRLAPGAQTLAAEQYEVIVTDDGSQTTAEQMILEQYGWAKWIKGLGRGPASNRNNGVKHAQGQWLAFCDDDCLPDSQWLESYARAINADPTCFVYEGRVYVDRPKRSLAESAPIFETGGYLPSGNFICSKDVFESLGGFDERFPYAAMEDVDFRTRLLKAGHRFLFIREAAVCHPWREMGDWKSFKRAQESTFIYLSIHTEEQARINALHNLRMSLHKLISDTIPGIVKFRGRGMWKALVEHVCIMQGAILLFMFRSRKAIPGCKFKETLL